VLGDALDDAQDGAYSDHLGGGVLGEAVVSGAHSGDLAV
jgi:hypothetical protein